MTKWLCIALVLVACQPPERKTFVPGSLAIHLADEKPQASWQPMIVAGFGETIYVDPRPVMTEQHLRVLRVGKGASNDAILMMRFSDEGTALLARVTEANIGKRLAFVVQGRVVSAPVLRERIDRGEAIIEGGFTEEEATRLAKAIGGS